MSMISGRRRSRPLELYEHDYVDTRKVVEVELILDEEDYRFKWPSAPLSRFLTAAAASIPSASDGSGSTPSRGSLSRGSDGGTTGQRPTTPSSAAVCAYPRIALPHVFVATADEEWRDDGSGEDSEVVAMCDAASNRVVGALTGCSDVLSPGRKPTPSLVDNAQHMFLFTTEHVADLARRGFLRDRFPPDGEGSDSSGNVVTAWGQLHPLWIEGMLCVTELEERTFYEAQGKTLSALRLLALSQAIPLTTILPRAVANVVVSSASSAAATSTTWEGSLTVWDAEILYRWWIDCRIKLASHVRPWGAALIPRFRGSFAWDEFFLSQQASAAAMSAPSFLLLTEAGSSSAAAPADVLGSASTRGSHGILSDPQLQLLRQCHDFGLRLKRDRRGGTVGAMFGCLPFDISQGSAWSAQQSTWSLVALGRRALQQRDVETLVKSMPPLHDVPLRHRWSEATPSGKASASSAPQRTSRSAAQTSAHTAAGTYTAATSCVDRFLSKEMLECAKLLALVQHASKPPSAT